MAITNYSELKTALSGWLDRSDLSSNIDDFIDLAEAAINKDLRIRDLETSATITLVAATKDYAISTNLPGLLEIRSVQLASTTPRTLRYFPPDVLKTLWEVDPDGDVRGYTLLSDTFRVAPGPDSANAVDCVVTYYKAVTPLDATNTTNNVLTNNPDIYLYGALIHAAPYLIEDARVPIWQEMYQKAFDSANKGDRRGYHQGPPKDGSGSR